MKFESKFGLGEVVEFQSKKATNHEFQTMMEVQGIYFNIDGSAQYICRFPNGSVSACYESQLVGDHDFSQETGYP